jgi:hypothetical protein
MRYFIVSYFCNDYSNEDYSTETFIVVSQNYPSRSTLSSFGNVISGRNTNTDLSGISEISEQDAIDYLDNDMENVYDLIESVVNKSTTTYKKVVD